jgi:hypothetical protein
MLYSEYARFDLSTIESCSEIPACRGREVLSLLIEVDHHLRERIRAIPRCLPEGVSPESREVLEKIISGGKITGDITTEFLEALFGFEPQLLSYRLPDKIYVLRANLVALA